MDVPPGILMQQVTNASPQGNPLAVFLADPTSHLGDILYLNFRLYKRELIYKLFMRALDDTQSPATGTLNVADVGASMGFDMKYVLNRLTGGFSQRPRWG